MNETTRAMPGAAAGAAMLLAMAVSAAWADENEIPFSEAELFFELNDTDGDLGLHGMIDGEDWKRLIIQAPGEVVLMDVIARGNLRRHGLTELTFESAEPGFDEVSPEEILSLFPRGVYEIEGITLEGAELESEVEISHVIPAAPRLVQPRFAPCDRPVLVTPPVLIDWRPVTRSHPEIGDAGEIEVERYEVGLEQLDGELNLFVELPPGRSQFKVPSLFTSTPGIVKFEVLVKAANGNRTAVESCFRIR